MLKNLFLLFSISILLSGCDTKKSGISGTVVNKNTGVGVPEVLISFIQCKSNGENCTELVIGQMYTSADGSFVISEKMGSKSKTKWITAYKNGKKLAQKDNVGLNDKNMIIEVEL
jgi:hypothetical protein